MLRMSLDTFRERWPLFVGTFLAVALAVGLVVSSVLILLAADRYAAQHPEQARAADDLNAFVAIVLTVGVFLSLLIIGSTFAFAVQERRRDLALLRISGASRRQIRLLLHAEGLIVGVLGTFAGLGVGVVLARLELVFVGMLGLPAGALDPRATPAVVLWSLLGGLVVSVLGVRTPARRAARVLPLEALTDRGAAARVMTFGRWFWGVAFAAAAVGGAATMQAVAGSASDGAIALSLPVIFAGAISVQKFSPLLVPALAKTAGLLARPWVEAELAASTLVDAKRRTATVAGPLIALTGIVVGLFAMLQTLAAAEGVDRVNSTAADLVIESEGPISAGVDRIDGVAAATALSRVDGTVSGSPETAGGARSLLVADPDTYGQVMTTTLSPGAAQAFGDGAVIVGDDAEGRLRASERLTVTVDGTSSDLAVAGHTEGAMIADPFDVIVPRAALDEGALQHAPTRTMIVVADGTPVDRVRQNLAAAGHDAVPVSEWAGERVAAGQSESNVVMIGLTGIGAVTALLSVVNAVALSAAARKREFAVDRVIGLSRAQVVRTSVLESGMVGVLGIMLGGVVAAALMVGLRAALERMLGEPVLVIPWGAFGAVAAVSLCAVTATAAIATLIATRPRPITLAAARE